MSDRAFQPVQQTVVVQQAPSTPSNGLGTSGFVISIVGFLTCGLLCPLGLLLSLFGLLKPPRGLAIAGTILGGLGSLWLFLFGFALLAGVLGIGRAASEAAQEMQRQNDAARQRIVGKAPAPATGPSVSPSEPLPDTEEVAGASESVQRGDAMLRVTGLSVDYVQIESFSSGKSQDKLLMISLELTNTSPAKIMNYRGWSAQWSDFTSSDRASLKDNIGNTYKRVHFGPGSRVDGQVTSNESIYPNKSLTDVLVFEPPTDACQYLVLELPASAVGGTGMFRLRIPRAMWAQEEIPLEPIPSPVEQSEPSADAITQQQPTTTRPDTQSPDESEPPTARNMRTWHAKSGSYTVEAEYLWHTPDTVCLRRADGEQIKVPMEKLSDEDVAWIKQQLKR